MKQTYQHPRSRIKAIKEHCLLPHNKEKLCKWLERLKRPHSPLRWDKYENKQLFWVEREVECEWKRTVAKTRRVESEFESNVNAASAIEPASAPLTFGPPAHGPADEAGAAGGGILFFLLNTCWSVFSMNRTRNGR